MELGTPERTEDFTECSTWLTHLEHAMCLRVTMRRVGEADGSGAVLLVVG